MRLIRTILGFDKPAGKLGALLHEICIVLAFCAFTAALSWPYVNYLRDVVADPGDPYLVSWILWWDYHQTFTDPLNLFHANLFYPYRYTLAFSEHSYGIALPFFPLFALGFRPLTVHAVAIFFGFALCGYGAFRLARTLTGSEAVAWVTGIVFAFVPMRFDMLSHLLYLFSPWIPLQFEALVLFVRERSRKRAAWLGFAFFMSGLTCISWFTLALVPFALVGAILLTRYTSWNDRQFWFRGAVALGLAMVALLPFMVPYYLVSKLYGFQRSIAEVKANSASPIHWLSVANRNKLWNGMGENMTDGYRFRLFPGLLPILLSLVAVLAVEPLKGNAARANQEPRSRKGVIGWLDVIITIALALSILAVGFEGSAYFHNFFKHITSERALTLLTVATIARLCLAYPSFLKRGESANLVETLRSPRRNDAFWVGLVLTIVGFCYSLGWNFFFYRICYDLIVIFRSMRVPSRGAMFACLGLAILTGLGAKRLAEIISDRQPRIRPALVSVVACALLLFELNTAPLKMMRGDIYPDAVTLRLKDTPMSGGVVVLPAGADFNHRHILRSADHQKPLIVGTSGFNSPYEDQIEAATRAGAISDQFLELLEKIPTSYVVVENNLIVPERRVDYETFLTRAVTAGRLRFVNRFDGRDDLYAVVKTEPQAKTEAPVPLALEVKDWQELIGEDPVNMLGNYRSWSQTVYRIYVASYGDLPRYSEFLSDVKLIGRGAMANSPDEQTKMEANLSEFATAWVMRTKFRALYNSMANERYVDTLSENARITLAPAERAALIEKLSSGATTRAQVLLTIGNSSVFVIQEENRSLVLLHYFGYLHRNPDDPPDKNFNGFNFWIREVEKSGDTSRLTKAFLASGEYEHSARK
jgi:hypothetical protein